MTTEAQTATALVKTAEYRNPRPTQLEEWLFYGHASVDVCAA